MSRSLSRKHHEPINPELIVRNEVRIRLRQEDVMQLIQRLAAHGTSEIILDVRVTRTEFDGGQLVDISMNGNTGIIAKGIKQFVSVENTDQELN
jgi:hypothetical protein